MPGQHNAGMANRCASLSVDRSEGVSERAKENERINSREKKQGFSFAVCSAPLLSGLMRGGWRSH